MSSQCGKNKIWNPKTKRCINDTTANRKRLNLSPRRRKRLPSSSSKNKIKNAIDRDAINNEIIFDAYKHIVDIGTNFSVTYGLDMQESDKTEMSSFLEFLKRNHKIREKYLKYKQDPQKTFLGSGSYGSVFRYCPSESKCIAVKSIKLYNIRSNLLDALLYIRMEIYLLSYVAKLGAQQKPNPFPKLEWVYYDLSRKQPTVYVAMNLIKGSTLRDYINRTPKISEIRIAEIMTQIFKALHILHSHQIIHKDIKPDNIMYNPTTHKITFIDFGMSCIPLKYPCGIGGTKVYMSPPYIHNRNYHISPSFEVFKENDLWGAAIIFGELILGKHPIKYAANKNKYKNREYYNVLKNVMKNKQIIAETDPNVSHLHPYIPKLFNYLTLALIGNPNHENFTANATYRTFEKHFNWLKSQNV